MEKVEGVGWVMIPPQIMATDLPAGHKILLGKILGLLGDKGYCWASNRWLAANTGYKPGTISGYITDLVDAGYIKRVIEVNTKTKVESRHLFPVLSKPTPPDDSRTPLRQQSHPM